MDRPQKVLRCQTLVCYYPDDRSEKTEMVFGLAGILSQSSLTKIMDSPECHLKQSSSPTASVFAETMSTTLLLCLENEDFKKICSTLPEKLATPEPEEEQGSEK